MRLITKILKVLAIALLVIAAIGLIFFSSRIHVERSITINQKQDVLFNYVNDLRNWNNWTPWYQLDTMAKFTYEGPQSGTGAIIRWDSNNKDVGKGSIIIFESKPDSLIRQHLNFMEQKDTAHSYFRFEPVTGGTLVKWGFDVDAGANPLLRIMGSFMDDYIGMDFDKGLSRLKEVAESILATDTLTIN
jgi:uncharacterized membrane protein